MNLVQITPGAGGMYCGNCFRDNALVSELRRQGHDTVMVPMYLPMTLDEAPALGDSPTFFGGINVFLSQKSALHRRAPAWFHNLKAHPEVEVNVGRSRFGAMAIPVLPDNSDYPRLWRIVNANNAGRYDGYQARTSRPIPVIRLTPS